jgi:hypothetical protein
MYDAEILEEMVSNEIIINMLPKKRFPIKLKVKTDGRGKPAFRNLETEIDCKLPRLPKQNKNVRDMNR